MISIFKKAIYLILLSFGIAVIFNALFFGKELGISVFIFVGIFLAIVISAAKYLNLSLNKSWWLIAAIGFFALMPAVRAKEFLLLLNLLAVFGLLMLLIRQLTGTPVFIMRIWDYVLLLVKMPFQMLHDAAMAIFRIAQFHSEIKQRDTWLQVLKGAAAAVPILIIFGILFSHADLAFSHFINSFVDITISEHEYQYLALLILSFAAALSYLSFLFLRIPDKGEEAQAQGNDADPVQSDLRSDRGTTIMVCLGLIAALFLLFIIFQITYLFGGQSNIINAGFTYAEYARRGFGELLAVGILSLVMLLAAEKYAQVESIKDMRFLAPALVLVVEVMIVILSAFKRLSLYIDAYGMTTARFYAVVLIILIALLFILLAVKFIFSKKEQFFTFGALLSMIAVLAVINAINPDASIVRTNIKQFNETGKVDVLYVEEMSADAVAEEIKLYKDLEGAAKESMRQQLEKQRVRLQEGTGWESYNLSRQKARKLLQEVDWK
jgi:Domain of unknown function (DUF4173)